MLAVEWPGNARLCLLILQRNSKARNISTAWDKAVWVYAPIEASISYIRTIHSQTITVILGAVVYMLYQ